MGNDLYFANFNGLYRLAAGDIVVKALSWGKVANSILAGAGAFGDGELAGRFRRGGGQPDPALCGKWAVDGDLVEGPWGFGGVSFAGDGDQFADREQLPGASASIGWLLSEQRVGVESAGVAPIGHFAADGIFV